jgi:Polyketide cyclase / dehydrase and lipid transport
MKTTTKPRLTFEASARSAASPEALYDVLADVTTHRVWGGEKAPRKSFRLLTMEAAARPAAVGDTFASTGANSNGTFHDRSVVVEAERGVRFGFDTDSRLDRKHGRELHARFEHRYTIERDGAGSKVTFRSSVFPQNYVPYWLRTGMRPMTRRMVNRMMAANLRNAAAMAESREREASPAA